MFLINDDLSIYITRGDSALFQVSARVSDTERYTFKAGDVVRINVFEKKACENVVLSKCFGIEEETDVVTIYLEEKETRIGDVISKPKDYWYEIELNPFTESQTIVGYDDDGAKVFKLFPEGNVVENEDITEEDIPIVDRELSLTSTRPIQNQAVAREIVLIKRQIEQMGFNGGSGGVSSGVGYIFLDEETLKYYVLKVVNGKLTMEEYDGDIGGDTGGGSGDNGNTGGNTGGDTGGEYFGITEQPYGVTANAGDVAVFTIEAEGSDVRFEWEKSADNGTAWTSLNDGSSKYTITSTGTASTLQINSVTSSDASYLYRCTVHFYDRYKIRSESVSLTVNSGSSGGNTGGEVGGDEPRALAVTKQPQNTSAKVSAGENAFFTVEATGDGLTFMWKISEDNGSSWRDLSKSSDYKITNTATSSTLRVDSVTSNDIGDMYKCVIVDDYGSTVTTNAVTLSLDSSGDAGGEEPEEPVVTYTISRTLSNCTSSKTQKTVNEGESWSETLSPSTGYSLDSVTVKMGGTNITSSVYSNGKINISSVTGNIEITAKAVQIESLGIVSQPQNVSVEAGKGNDALFTVEAKGYELSFHWQKSEDNGSTWNELNNQLHKYSISSTDTTTVLRVESVTTNEINEMYKCIVKDGYGSSIASGTAKLLAMGDETGGENTGGGSDYNPIEITKQPVGVTIAKGDPATFSIEATGTNLSFQWKVGNNMVSMGDYDATSSDANSSTLTIHQKSGYVYLDQYVQCVVTDSNGNSVTSDTVRLIYAD